MIGKAIRIYKQKIEKIKDWEDQRCDEIRSKPPSFLTERYMSGNEGLGRREVPLPRRFHSASFWIDKLFHFSKSWLQNNKLTLKKKTMHFGKGKVKKVEMKLVGRCCTYKYHPMHIYLQKCHLIFPFITNRSRVWTVGTICQDKCMMCALNLNQFYSQNQKKT